MRAYTIPSIYTAVDKYTGPVRAMAAATKSFVATSETGLARVERGFRKLTTPINNVFKSLNQFGFYFGLFSLAMVLGNNIKVMADFEQAQVNLASVMDKKSIPFMGQMSMQARSLSVQYGIAAKSVSELQYELVKMGFAGVDVMKMTPAITTGAVALRTEADKLAQVVGAVLKTFDKEFKAGDTTKIVDMMAKIVDITALDANTLFEMLPRAMKFAADANVPFVDLLSTMGALKDSMLPVASSATGFKNILIDSSVRGKDYRKELERITSSANTLVAAYKKFGRKTASSALVLGSAEQRGDLDKFRKLLGESLGYSAQLAEKQLDSFWGTLRKTKTAYQEFILGIDDGTGKYSATLKELDRVVAAMFLMGSGSQAAMEELARMNKTTKATAQRWMEWLVWVKRVVIFLVAVKIAMIAWRAVVIATTIVMSLYNIALGVTGALSATAAVAIGQSAVALIAYKVAAGLAAAGTWLLNSALLANPIGAVITAVVALTVAIGAMVINWQRWGAAVALVLAVLGGPFWLVIGTAISLVQSFRRNWDLVVNAFKIDGIIAGFKMIGTVILDAVLQPLQQLIEIIADLTGFDWAQSAAEKIAKLRADLSVNVKTDEAGQSLRKKVTPFEDRAINNKALWPGQLTKEMAEFQQKIAASKDQYKLDYYPAGMEEKRQMGDTATARQESFNETLSRSVQQLEIRLRSEPGTQAEVSRRPQGIPIKVESSMGW